MRTPTLAQWEAMTPKQQKKVHLPEPTFAEWEALSPDKRLHFMYLVFERADESQKKLDEYNARVARGESSFELAFCTIL